MHHIRMNIEINSAACHADGRRNIIQLLIAILFNCVFRIQSFFLSDFFELVRLLINPVDIIMR